jgi:hypothetical protein
MAEPGSVHTPLQQHVVVVGADTTTVRLVEELARSGEQLVVIAHSENPRGAIADIEALGCLVITATHVREAELRAAAVERARAAVVLGDDDVLALRVGLMIDELAPGLRIVIEMTNPRLGGRLTSLIGDCTLLSSAELAAPAFVAAALATPDTQSFEIGGRSVAAGPRDRIGGELLADIGGHAAYRHRRRPSTKRGRPGARYQAARHDSKRARTSGMVPRTRPDHTSAREAPGWRFSAQRHERRPFRAF